ncbi:MAG: YihY/virulence factor BrkB family protein [Bdellovibrionales bacterium]|nr:YihY/virulence factor BrkB family protein [Bdellovibrionales bacterium]
MLSLVKKTFVEFSSDRAPQMAAAIAYYAIFSLPALLVLVLMVCGFFVDPAAIQGRIGDEIASVLGADAANQVRNMIEVAGQETGRGFAGIMGIVALLFGATGVVAQLQTALNTAWDVEPDPESGGVRTFVTKRLLSVALLLTVAFLLLVSLLLSAALSALGSTVEQWLPPSLSESALWTMSNGLTLLMTVLLFAAIFKVLPDADTRWSDVWLGAATTAILFTAGKLALSYYIGAKDSVSAYGAAGSLVLIMLWIYYSSLILLLGAELTQVWARRHGAQILPSKGAVRIVEHREVIREPETARPA